MTLREFFPPEIEAELTIRREIEPKYFDFLLRILNDQTILGKARKVVPVTLESHQKWYEEYLKRDERHYVVLRKLDGKPIGTTAVLRFEPDVMYVLGGRFVMDKNAVENYRRYLFDSSTRHMDYIFNKGIKRSYSYVAKGNVAAERWHQRMGYYKTDEHHFKEFLNGREDMYDEWTLTPENFHRAKPMMKTLYVK